MVTGVCNNQQSGGLEDRGSICDSSTVRSPKEMRGGRSREEWFGGGASLVCLTVLVRISS